MRVNLADHERMILVLFSQEGAIKKILGQDSSRKKRGDKIKKRLDELAQVLGYKHSINHLIANVFLLSQNEMLKIRVTCVCRRRLHMRREPQLATSEQ